MQNPFETGHIKNYILLYVSVVVIVILFFIASSLFNEVEQKDKKVFAKKEQSSKKIEKIDNIEDKKDSRFKVLEKAY